MKYLMAFILLVSGAALAETQAPKLGEWSKDQPPCPCISSAKWSKMSEQEKVMVKAQFSKAKKGN